MTEHTPRASTVKPTRHRAPIKRVHKGGTGCTHRIGPSGKPREGESCPGVAGYTATCLAADCDWTSEASIRAIVEEAKRGHLHHASRAAVADTTPAAAPRS